MGPEVFDYIIMGALFIACIGMITFAIFFIRCAVESILNKELNRIERERVEEYIRLREEARLRDGHH